jgi:DNA polymerase-3 subunit alpha
LEKFNVALGKAKFIVGQNLGFDLNIMGCGISSFGSGRPNEVKCQFSIPVQSYRFLIKLPGGRGGRFNYPRNGISFFFNKAFGEAHNATADVEATTRCFLELIRRELYQEQLDVKLVIFRNQSKIKGDSAYWVKVST